MKWIKSIFNSHFWQLFNNNDQRFVYFALCLYFLSQSQMILTTINHSIKRKTNFLEYWYLQGLVRLANEHAHKVCFAHITSSKMVNGEVVRSI